MAKRCLGNEHGVILALVIYFAIAVCLDKQAARDDLLTAETWLVEWSGAAPRIFGAEHRYLNSLEFVLTKTREKLRTGITPSNWTYDL